MKNFFKQLSLKNIKSFAIEHKAISALIAVALFSAGYGTLKANSNSNVTRYVLGTVTRGTLETSVSGTGTVEASDQIDVKAKASGDILSVDVHTGDHVAQGQTLVEINPQDAAIALQSSQIALQKLEEPADQATLIADKQAVTDAETAGQAAYANAWNEVSSTFDDLPTIIDSMNNLFYTTSGYLSDQNITSLGTTAMTYRNTAGAAFDQAKSEYDNLSAFYKQTKDTSATSTLNELYSRTQTTLADLLNALKETSSAVSYVKSITTSSPDPNSVKQALASAETAQTNLSTWTSQVQTHINSLTGYMTTIVSTPDTIAEKEAALAKLEQGPDPLDIQAQELDLQTKQEAYDNYFITAPFDGIVGKVDVNQGDSISSGSVAATIISSNQVAEVSLNEVDAAKVKIGDKALMTFDAVDGLTITGTVTELDLVGTVTQGVVNYNAKIAFDTGDPRVLPGMSVNANIIVNVDNNVLIVPSSAVKTDTQGNSYVLAFRPALTNTGGTQGVASAIPPQQITVQTGNSDDTNTEIVSGLNEGDQIVTRTISATTAKTATTQSPTLFGGGAGRAGGGNAAGAATRALGR